MLAACNAPAPGLPATSSTPVGEAPSHLTVYGLAADGILPTSSVENAPQSLMGAEAPAVGLELGGEVRAFAMPIPAHTADSTVTAASVPAQLTEDEMDAALAEAGWPAELRHAAKCTFWRESRWSPGAVSASNDHGLAQLNGFWATFFGPEWEHRYEPVANLRMALVVFERGGGWGPWRAAC